MVVVTQSREQRFESLAGEVLEPVRRFLARRADPATADDVLSETLLVCWRRLDDVPDPPLPWVYAVARHALSNAQRAARRQGRLAARVATVDPPPAQAGPGEDPASAELATLTAQALDSLPARDAELLRLWAWEQLGPSDIAVVLGITPNAVSIRLHRARQRFAEALRKIEGDAGHVSGERRRP